MLAEAANALLSEGLHSPPSQREHESDEEDMLSADAHAHCKDEVDFAPLSGGSSVESALLSPQLGYDPRPVPLAPTWSVLVDDFRRAAVPLIWEVFSGTAGLTAAFVAVGRATARPLDVCLDTSFNLSNRLLWAIVVG